MKTSALFGALSLVLLSACHSDNKDSQPETPVVKTPVSLKLEFLSRYSSHQFLVSAAEITAFDATSKRAFVVNAKSGSVDVLSLLDPATPKLIGQLQPSLTGAGKLSVNSVAVHQGLVALAIETEPKTQPGWVALYRAADLSLLGQTQVGALPDMLTFTPDGRYLLVANEGEPSDNYQIDPEGSVSVIDVRDPAKPVASTAHFRAFNNQKAALLAAGVRLYGPNASVAQDLEPEYLTVSDDSQTAWVSLQENNALAIIDIASASISRIVPLGTKDFGLTNQGIAASDTQTSIDIKPWPGVVGMYQPDTLANFRHQGKTYLVSANEGDARAWGEGDQAYWDGDVRQGFVEEIRLKHLVHKSGFSRRVGEDMPPQLSSLAAGALLNPQVFGYCGALAGDAGQCREDNLLGRLTLTWTHGYRQDAQGKPVLFNAAGEIDPQGDRLMYDKLYAYGGRSISIWSSEGQLVWDSGDQIERYLASADCRLGKDRKLPCAEFFNSNHEAGNSFGNRSDNKGPEPEALALGKLGDKTFAFVGLERMGGVMVFDITNPQAPNIVDYLNSREDWATEDPGTVLASVGDLGPEGIHFISAADSPSGEPLLLVGNEVSGTSAIYRLKLSY